jgi:heterodisulfide reductase subunit A
MRVEEGSELAEVKVGVFLSTCDDVAEILDVNALLRSAKAFPGTVVVRLGEDFASDAGLQAIQAAVTSQGVNRVVASICEPVTGKVRIGKAVQDVGLNSHLVETINLRDHCARPHRSEPDRATRKAQATLLAAVEKVKRSEPLDRLEYPVQQSCLVIGGGLAGIQAATNLADLGYAVHLVERAPFLGGLAARAGRFFPTDDCALCIGTSSCDLKGVAQTSRKCLYRSGFSEIPNVNVQTNAHVTAVDGGPGDYAITIEQRPVEPAYRHGYPAIHVVDDPHHPLGSAEEPSASTTLSLNVGSIIVATGFEEFDASVIKEYLYGEHPDVVTQLELARMLDAFGPTGGSLLRPSRGNEPNRVVMIQCVGSRDHRYHPYCSSICCMIALKHALMIREKYPGIDVQICYIDIRSWGRRHEKYYERVRDAGVKFVKGRPTEIYEDEASKRLIVDTEDALLGEFVELQADLVVLSTAFVPSRGTTELAGALGLELDDDGFFASYNAKVRPTETKLKGVFVCGGATFPKDSPTTALQAGSAALKAARFMRTGTFIRDQRTALVDPEYCGDCEFCPVTCPYGAIRLVPSNEHRVAQIDDLKCEGCGICVGTCPLNAITLRNSTEDQLLAQVNALVQYRSDDPIVVAFCCSECGGTALDSAGMAAIEYPANVRVVKVPCTGILQIHHFLDAFKAGADAVMVVGCKVDGCHYEEGSVHAERRVKLAKRLLRLYGIEPERLEMFHNVYIEGDQFAAEATLMVRRVESLNPLRIGVTCGE